MLAAIENKSIIDEFGLMVVGFPDSMELLNNPNIFIGDTGATSDSTPHVDGIVNLKNTSIGDNMTDASGKSN